MIQRSTGISWHTHFFLLIKQILSEAFLICVPKQLMHSWLFRSHILGGTIQVVPGMFSINVMIMNIADIYLIFTMCYDKHCTKLHCLILKTTLCVSCYFFLFTLQLRKLRWKKLRGRCPSSQSQDVAGLRLEWSVPGSRAKNLGHLF